jgi:two-component system chemotaxis response regulator CheB
MDGLEFLEKLMRLRPMPVVMVSSLTERGTEATLRALELGAVDFVAKPKLEIARGIEALGAAIADKIRTAALARVRRTASAPDASAGRPLLLSRRLSTEKLIAIGSSTGGTEALRVLLMQLPPNSPGVLITQHMPAGFTRSFAERLDTLCRITVKEAEDKERILPGHAYIAPGDFHLRLGRSGANYIALLDNGPPVNRHRPSVEPLFLSVAQHAGQNAVGIMLTGMGKDGATAMLAMREAGAFNIAQDEATCVVFGMPKEAIAVGATHEVLPLAAIAPRALRHLESMGAGTVRV